MSGCTVTVERCILWSPHMKTSHVITCQRGLSQFKGSPKRSLLSSKDTTREYLPCQYHMMHFASFSALMEIFYVCFVHEYHLTTLLLWYTVKYVIWSAEMKKPPQDGAHKGCSVCCIVLIGNVMEAAIHHTLFVVKIATTINVSRCNWEINLKIVFNIKIEILIILIPLSFWTNVDTKNLEKNQM